MSRWVLVDDTDSGIQYTGSWFQDQGSQNSLGNFGPPYLSTLHGTNSGGSFSYTFQGSKVLITGTVQYPTSASGATNPSWECIVDGVSTPSLLYSGAENRLRLCEMDGLTDNSHTITVKATVSDQHTFWFDYIQYLPSSSTNLNSAALSVDVSDPGLQYGAGWQARSPGYMTTQTGSSFNFDFMGTSLTWLGFYDKNLPIAATTATYSVDGQTPIPFNLNGGSASATGVQYNQIFFMASNLAPGNHKLQVVYQGNAQTTPLTVSVLLVQGGSSTSSGTGPPSGPITAGGSNPPASSSTSNTLGGKSSSTSISISPSPVSPSFSGSAVPSTSGQPAITSAALSSSVTSGPAPDSNLHKSNVGAIVGGVIGGLALLLLAIFGCIWLRSRKRRSSTSNLEVVQPFRPISSAPILSPFIHHPASVPVSHSQYDPFSTTAGPEPGPSSSVSHTATTASPRNEKSLLLYSQQSTSPTYTALQPNRSQAGYMPASPGSPLQQNSVTSSSSSSSQADYGSDSPMTTPFRNEKSVLVLQNSSPSTPTHPRLQPNRPETVIKSQSGYERTASNPPLPSSQVDYGHPRPVRDEDSGIRFPRTLQDGHVVELLPPGYSYA